MAIHGLLTVFSMGMRQRRGCRRELNAADVQSMTHANTDARDETVIAPPCRPPR